MVDMTLSRDMSSNEHEMNSTKKHIDKSQEMSSTVVGRIEITIRQMFKGIVPFIVIMRNGQHLTCRFAVPSIIYAPARLYAILQICRIFIFIHFVSHQADLELNTIFNR